MMRKMEVKRKVHKKTILPFSKRLPTSREKFITIGAADICLLKGRWGKKLITSLGLHRSLLSKRDRSFQDLFYY